MLIGLFVVCLTPVGTGAGVNDHSGIGYLEKGRKLPTAGWCVTVVSDVNLIPILQPDWHGIFEVDLKPGKYELTPIYVPPQVRGQAKPNFVIASPATPVEVVWKHFTFVGLPSALGCFTTIEIPLPPAGESQNDD